jgi:hypothetical protein
MRRVIMHAAIGLCLAGLAHAAGNSKTEGVCSTFGTKVEFVSTPSEAARLAKKEQKLVFVLHVSGNFEDPRFT